MSFNDDEPIDPFFVDEDEYEEDGVVDDNDDEDEDEDEDDGDEDEDSGDGDEDNGDDDEDDGNDDNDEPIVLPPGTTRPTVPKRIKLEIRKNDNAPIEESILKVMLELTGEEESRSRLDLVVVSGSMRAEKLHEFKIAMLYVMNKLSGIDRLSIVMYSSKAERLCPLRQMTKSSKEELKNLIKGLKYQVGTNITDGLETALNILKDRSVCSGRVGTIMLVSDLEENIGNAASVPVGNVPVHTFGFGNGHNPKLLKAITNNSRLGGTYSDVPEGELRLAFSQCLGGLLSVVAQDLTVTVSQIKDKSSIKQVSAGSYPQSIDNAAGSVTITFGDIYIQEVRKVLVDLHLPATRKKQGADVLKVSYTYKFDGESFEASPETLTVHRKSGLRAEEQQALPEVRVEEVRFLIAETIKQVTDEVDLESAEDKLKNDYFKLEDAELKHELEELLRYIQTRYLYERKGRSFAHSLLISLATQRHMTRGNYTRKSRLFATHTIQKFLEKDYYHTNDDPFKMIFNDDDPIVLPPGTTRPIVPGRVQLVIKNNDKAPLEENIQKVILELTGEEKSRPGLDLVVVLDVINSMEAELETAMLFLMKKLSVVDRLSIVNESTRLCPLLQMTESSQTELKKLITKLDNSTYSYITDGLKVALNILKDRSVSSGRVGAIMVMSDCEEEIRNAASVPVGNVPVHTFGFGNHHNLKLLKAIANNSRLGGTYSDVRKDNLSLAFSQCLGGLLSVVAHDLTVTVSQIKDVSTIKQPVAAGSYPQSNDSDAGSVTITFGDIYIQEVRKVLIDLHLPSSRKKQDAEVLKVSYTYRFHGELFIASPVTVRVCRMSGLTAEEQQAMPEVRAEEVRLLIAEVIKQVTTDADKGDLRGAHDKLVNGLLKLEDVDIENVKTELRPELEELLKLMQTSQEIYKSHARPFAYSLLNSLATQRQTARGNNIGKFQLFATPTMQESLEEAKKLHDIDNHEQYSTDTFNDDDPISSSGSGWVPRVPGLVQLKNTKNDKAPLQEYIQKVLLELSGVGYTNSELGLDLVAVLDVSSSMEGNKLAKMKIAMLLLIENLNYKDRLSIVEYSSKAKRLCPLRKMTERSQTKLKNLIDDLKAQPGTNITDGIETALNVLKDRSVSSGRVGVIILMSDGEQNQGGDAANVRVGNYPVFTFGFGEDHNPEVLIAIANNSWQGGTYAQVSMDNLNSTFGNCLDELQRVLVWDLTVTVTQIEKESTVKRAYAGRYLHSIDNAAGSVTLTFGTLYRQDVCRVLVDILLPVTKKEGEVDVLKVSYTYRNSFDGELFVANPSTVIVHRTSEFTDFPGSLFGEESFRDTCTAREIATVEVKLLIAEVIKQATGVADRKHLKSVRVELVHSLNTLGERGRDILTRYLRGYLKTLKAELEELSELMQSHTINEKQGRSFAYSLLISNFTQRGLQRGKFKLYASPAMREFLEEARMYDELDDLHCYMDRFICAVESIQMIIDRLNPRYRDR